LQDPSETSAAAVSSLKNQIADLQEELAALRAEDPTGADLVYHLGGSGSVTPISDAARAAYPEGLGYLADLVALPDVSRLRDYVERHRRLSRLRRPYEQWMETSTGLAVWVQAKFDADGDGTLVMQPVHDAAALSASLSLLPQRLEQSRLAASIWTRTSSR
jgi:hypothetical protein